MKIVDVICSAGRTGFYFDDQKAIKSGATNDGLAYIGDPVTKGFTSIRQPGESISVMLVLEDGQVALGDCAAVQYSGAGGRDPLFLAADFIPVIDKDIKPWLVGKDVATFLDNAKELDAMEINGQRLHTAIRYGVSQALLDASAKANKVTMAEVIKKEFNMTHKIERRPIFTQSGDDRYMNADKMIIKGAELLPHALINNVETKLGKDGSILKDYVAWLRDRIQTIGKDGYKPKMHIDVYGTIGEAFNLDVEKQAQYIVELEKTAAPFDLIIEGPMDAGNKEAQIENLAALTARLGELGSKAQLVADEWCNTFDDVVDFVNAKAGHIMQIKTPDLGSVHNVAQAVIYCNERGFGSYVGGTCNETDVSARATTNVALATKASQVLAKPGMGVDEGYMIVNNEMNRVVALANRK
ncbi:methylaspartate ammonia-lyase [Bacilli bacterium PM5-3]|nr:methylaspartate ammonia-lyase [Bacilli bacterium PM5-3]MDH6603212.1 methylaspartate ammonia-lyase [Bacilli bacterium PM5-9]